MTDQIPAEAVEAGARALFEESQELDQDNSWDDALPDDWREAWRYQAREVIVAALPFLRPEPSEVQHLWRPNGDSMCGEGGKFSDSPDLGERLLEVPVCARCFVAIRQAQRNARWGTVELNEAALAVNDEGGTK